MSKTLLFTTSYCVSNQEWTERVYKWYNYYTKSSLHYDKILILDDCSPVDPAWNECKIITDQFTSEPEASAFIFKFKNNLGRPAHLDYPGWFRSFSFAARYAYKFNYDKIIHIESDAYLISSSIIDWFNKTNSGWIPLWCSRHLFPETAIQLIGRDQIVNFYKTTQLPYNTYFRGSTIETCLPFTAVNQSFKGDRYSEYTDNIPADADYACQVRHDYKFT